MRKVFLCLVAGVAALAMADVAAVMVTDFAIAGAQPDAGVKSAVNRRGKTNALELGVFPSPSEHTIATIEVIGVSNAAIVYRDRKGQVLFHTDPLSNTTVVVRGVPLPEVTVRETARAPAQPVVIQPEPAAKSAPPAPTKVKLPDGCEPASSPLSPSGLSAERARCLT